MPPRRKSAPAGRVYKSSVPLQQTKLSAPKKRITYGKHSTRRAKEDSTLTQIGFVQLKNRPEEDDEDKEEESDYEAAAKKRKSKRRKTAGDNPSSSSTPWHTQTITQLEWSFSTNNDEEEGGEEAEIEAGKEERSIYSVPSSSPTIRRSANAPRLPSSMKRKRKESPLLGNDVGGSPILGESRSGSPITPGSTINSPIREEELPILEDDRGASPIQQMPPPRTPRKLMREEIPSSQSPATPFSIQSRGSVRQLSPLLERSVNIAIPFDPNRTPQDKYNQAPKLKVEDTFESGSTTLTTQVDDNATSPETRTSPAKSVRFALTESQGGQEEDEEDSPTPTVKKESTPCPSQIASHSKVKFEILDSDDEDEDESEEETGPKGSRQEQMASSTNLSQEPEDENDDQIEDEVPPADSTPGQEYLEEQDNETDEDDEHLDEEAIATVEPKAEPLDPSIGISEEPDDEPETYYGDIGKDTLVEADRIVSSFPGGEADDTELTGEERPMATGQTQIGETQRLSTQHLNYMEARTANSDIFISIHPQHVTNIVNRTKNHEFRTWAFAPTVRRIWIYETKPVSTVKYMAKISSGKKPGEIDDDHGLGNKDFNNKPRDGKHRAYEILQLYELANPVSLSEMISNGWVNSAPQKFSYLGPAVADELIANLKPPLFSDEDDEDEDPPSSITDTQEVEEQLLSTISQFTQPSLPPHRHSSIQHSIERSNLNEMRPPSSTEPTTPKKPSTPGLSQAETVDLTQYSFPRPAGQKDPEEDVVWESPARPVPSSTPKLPTPRARNPSNPNRGDEDSVVPYSMGSSQFLSKSQLLPESLLDEDLPGPPRFVHDSESEDDEL